MHTWAISSQPSPFMYLLNRDKAIRPFGELSKIKIREPGAHVQFATFAELSSILDHFAGVQVTPNSFSPAWRDAFGVVLYDESAHQLYRMRAAFVSIEAVQQALV